MPNAPAQLNRRHIAVPFASARLLADAGSAPCPTRTERPHMILYPCSKDRPFHWGPFPLEVLPRKESAVSVESALPAAAAEARIPSSAPLPDDL